MVSMASTRCSPTGGLDPEELVSRHAHTGLSFGLGNDKPEVRRGLGRPCAGHHMPRRGQQRRYPVDPDASRAAVRGMLGPGPV